MLDDGEIEVRSSNSRFSWVAFVTNMFLGFVDRITPLRSKTELIKLKMDKTVASLFTTFRFLIGLSMVNIINFAFLIYKQLQNIPDKTKLLDDSCTYSKSLPCFTLYSAFDPRLSLNFAVTLMLFLIVGLIANLNQWVKFDKEGNRKRVATLSATPLLAKLLNPWDWRNQKEELVDALCGNLLSDLQFEVYR